MKSSNDKGQVPYEITGEHLLKTDCAKLPFLWESIFQKVGLACFGGSSDTGKSAFLRQLAIAVSIGKKEFLGFKLNLVHNSAVFVATEDGQHATSYLLKCQTQDLQPEDLKGLRFIFEPNNLIMELDACLSSKPADLVVIDCFGDVYPNSMNDSQQIRAFLNPFQALAAKHSCLILFLHHTGKRTDAQAPSKNNLLGGQGFEAKMRVVLELRTDNSDSSIKHLCIVKGNYLPPNLKKESIVLKFDEKSFSFIDSGRRVRLDQLVKPDDKKIARYQQAKQLKAQGKSYDEIAEVVGVKSKSAVSKILANGAKFELPLSEDVEDNESDK